MSERAASDARTGLARLQLDPGHPIEGLGEVVRAIITCGTPQAAIVSVMWRTTSVGCHSNPRIGQSFYGAVVFRHKRARPRARIVAPTLAQGAVADPQRRLMAETECGAFGGANLMWWTTPDG